MSNAELNRYAVIQLLLRSAKLSVRWVDLISYKVKSNLIFLLRCFAMYLSFCFSSNNLILLSVLLMSHVRFEIQSWEVVHLVQTRFRAQMFFSYENSMQLTSSCFPLLKCVLELIRWDRWLAIPRVASHRLCAGITRACPVLSIFVCFAFWDRISLWSPGCPGAHCVDDDTDL